MWLKSFLLLFFLTTTTTLAASTKKKKKIYDTSQYLNICKKTSSRNARTLGTRHDHKTLQFLLSVSGPSSIASETSHQNKAACWILQTDERSKKCRPSANSCLGQRYALAVLFYATMGHEKWGQKQNWLNPKRSECTWYGIICGHTSTLIDVLSPIPGGIILELQLGFNELNGLLPRELALLSNLREVDVHGNDLQGILPYSIMYAWKDLQILRLHMNGFFGSLHSEIQHLRNLRELYAFGNYLGGTVPTELGNLKHLEKLDVYANALEGRIPSELAKLSKLKELDLHDNFLAGHVPKELCDKNKGPKQLKFFVADCLDGKYKEVSCPCCTICCEGLPNMRCVDMTTKREVIVGVSEQKKMTLGTTSNKNKKTK